MSRHLCGAGTARWTFARLDAMAVKRKAVEAAQAASQKKLRIDADEEQVQTGWQSGDSGDDYNHVDYTEKGTLRADSEARRQWNYVCTFQGCDKRFNRPVRLEQHMRSHSKERPFACSEPGCDKTFPRKDHLQRHIKNAHGDPDIERTFTCDWPGCGKSFTSNGRLQRHGDVHESKFYCTEYPPCSLAFRKEKALEAHIKSQHLEVKPYPCTFVDPETGEKCINSYQAESALRRHVWKKHEGGQENALFCMICADVPQSETGVMMDSPIQMLSFANREELAGHIQQCHPPECTECGQRFKNSANLKSHFDSVHGDPCSQPQYPCPKPDCNSVFTRKHNLTVHIQTVHDKEARYRCTPNALQNSKHDDLKNWDGENACGVAFKAKSSLDQHVRTHHLGLGNRKQLRKAAKSKKKPDPSTLSMLTGVGYEKNREVPCVVNTCQYRFYMDRDLRRHLRATHDIPDDDIEEMIRERDALTGGQFWIGGLEDPTDMFDSVEPSMPQTPAPYFAQGTTPCDKPDEFNFFDSHLDTLPLLNEDADLDFAMGLRALPPAMDVQQGLQWDLLAPIEQFNIDGEY